MTKILIVADDLTGALDSSVAFASRGLRTLVVRDLAGIGQALSQGPDVLALATGTRELPERGAVDMVEAMLAGIGPWPGLVFKKVDSRLKGHVLAETAAMTRLLDCREAIVAPAIPDFGRLVRNGQLSGHGIERAIDIAALFAALPVPAHIPDIGEAADFAPILDGIDVSTLLVGARGLAMAVADRIAPAAARSAPPVPHPVLVAIGSRDPITLAQVAALEKHGGPASIAAPNGQVPAETVAAGDLLVRMTPGVAPSPSETASATFAQGLAALVTDRWPVGILASGGETGNSLLAALGVSVLSVEGEVLPGMPLSRFTLAGRSLGLVTKSGGFGAPDALIRLLARGD